MKSNGSTLIQAVIWDMDGVLIDSEPFWRQAEVDILSDLGVPITLADTAETMGHRIDSVIRLWYNRFPWDGPSTHEVAQSVVSRVVDLVHEVGEIKPGVYEALDLLRSRNLRFALASSSPSELIDAILDKLKLAAHFEFTHSAESELFGKPHPAVYLSAARKLGLAPENCLAIEDSFAGVKSAKGAGMKCLCVPDPSLDRSKLEEADLILNSLADLRLVHLEALEAMSLKAPDHP